MSAERGEVGAEALNPTKAGPGADPVDPKESLEEEEEIDFPHNVHTLG